MEQNRSPRRCSGRAWAAVGPTSSCLTGSPGVLEVHSTSQPSQWLARDSGDTNSRPSFEAPGVHLSRSHLFKEVRDIFQVIKVHLTKMQASSFDFGPWSVSGMSRANNQTSPCLYMTRDLQLASAAFSRLASCPLEPVASPWRLGLQQPQLATCGALNIQHSQRP